MAFRSKRKPHPFEVIRATIRAHLYPKLAKRVEQFKHDERFPFEGGWYSRTEILLWREEMQKRDRERLINVLALFGMGGGFAILLVLILLFAL